MFDKIHRCKSKWQKTNESSENQWFWSLTDFYFIIPNKSNQILQSNTFLPKDASTAINSEGFVLLDIRPTWEREKARVAGSLHVPMFVEDTDNSPITLLKKWVHFGYIGLWTGQYLTTLNSEFLIQVENSIPTGKETKLLVACGGGLRSMAAASKLYNGGYKNLGWLAGGFNRSKNNDFPTVEGKEKLQHATVGGASYF
ncbi:rhodanese-like domain-containing protein 10 [Glycine max]|uniref:rhodanese-like domain-containing protein 10 n=1 Tax=Glycine max TaxID=3847 RepID=UPI001B356CCA|nr:rhodanese-like domain-containing protein 10 [Glycine max]